MKNSHTNTVIFPHRTSLAISALLLSLNINCAPAHAAGNWGAKPLTDKYRPQRTWIDKFAATPDVIAISSITDAIDSCDDIVGRNKYCVVEISNTAHGLPLEIWRSKTKLIGVANMQALTSASNGTFIYIGDNTQQVVIEGLNLQGHSVGNDEIYGIIIDGKKIKNILIRNNKIHHFDSDSNAHGIAIYGSGKNGRESIRHVIIEGNEVYSMRTGSSESIVVNGNVKNWEIINNDIYDVNNIAIDAIGGEGTSKTRHIGRGSNRRILPGRYDAASYGFIEDNFVENMSTLDNPAYGNEASWAAAIYIDGGHHISLRDNVVVNTPWAYEVGAENCITSAHISITGNSANQSYFGDLLLGGYAETGYRADKNINCNPNNTQDKSEGHGYVRQLTVKDNYFDSQNTQLSGPVTLQYRITRSIIIEPNVLPENASGNGRVRGDENSIRVAE